MKRLITLLKLKRFYKTYGNAIGYNPTVTMCALDDAGFITQALYDIKIVGEASDDDSFAKLYHAVEKYRVR